MIRVVLAALLLLTLAGCVPAMPEHDENNLVMNKTWHDGPRPWPPSMLH